MTQPTTDERTVARNPVFTAVANHRRRHILTLLLDRMSPVTEEDLAINLAATEQEKSLLAVTEEEVQSIRTGLTHVQLPALENANLVSWDRTTETVTTTDHPAPQDPKFTRIIETDAHGWDDVLANLAYTRRRIVLSILKDQKAPISRTALAQRITTYETDEGTTSDVDPSEALCASLHHVHLPRLQQAGFITYDTDANTVTYEGHQALEDEWLDFGVSEEPRAILPAAHNSDEVWTITGRDNVIARGQSLFEQADDELFLMFTTEGLLEEGCIRRLRDAVDRGVDVYLGSQTAEVRDLVRERVPGAVIWEPQMDWLNLPPEYEKVGRLVFADRTAIMLATLGEKTDKGVHKEAAITGTGENNTIVMLMRELLGSRLDHLDAQSEEFLSELPL